MVTSSSLLSQVPADVVCVKKLSESSGVSEIIASKYSYFKLPDEAEAADHHDSIPIIDISMLNSDDPDQRYKAVQDLGKACEDWGFFMAVNHGIPEELLTKILDLSDGFFNLAEEDKPEFEPKNVLVPVRYGTSFNTARENIHCWRDFLKVFMHPQFHYPPKPEAFRDLLSEYSSRTREMVRILAKGVSQSLGLEDCEMEKALNLGSGLQIFAANLYPPCPQPEVALGMFLHSDHGLFTLLVQNGVGGLQIQHEGRWVNVNPIPGSILVNTGDHLEIFSNGKYKSVLHRATTNNERTRISIATTNGPSLDTLISPSSKLLQTPRFIPMKYKEYLLAQQNNKLEGKSLLSQITIQDNLSKTLFSSM